MVQPPPLRSVMTHQQRTYLSAASVGWWLWCRHNFEYICSSWLLLGDHNSSGYRGGKWAPPPDRLWEASVWEGWDGHVSADHTLLPGRSAEHQAVARQLRSTPCMVRVTGQDWLTSITVKLEFVLIIDVTHRYVNKVMVQDLESGQKWHFLCNSWLAVDVGECALDKVFPVATEMDLKRFR